MAQQDITITGGTPPYTVVITDQSTTQVIPCTSGCASSAATQRTLQFAQLSGAHTYRISMTDSSNPACRVEYITQPLTCTTAPIFPAFNLLVTQPTCTSGVLSGAGITVVNIANAVRYKVLTTDLSNVCAGALPISAGVLWFLEPVPAPASGASIVYTVRLWPTTTDCSNYTDHQITLTSPVCQPPAGCTLNFTLGTIIC